MVKEPLPSIILWVHSHSFLALIMACQWGLHLGLLGPGEWIPRADTSKDRLTHPGLAWESMLHHVLHILVVQAVTRAQSSQAGRKQSDKILKERESWKRHCSHFWKYNLTEPDVQHTCLSLIKYYCKTYRKLNERCVSPPHWMHGLQAPREQARSIYRARRLQCW